MGSMMGRSPLGMSSMMGMRGLGSMGMMGSRGMGMMGSRGLMGGLGSSSLMSLSMMNRLRGRSSSSDDLLLGLGVMIPHVPLKFELIDWQVLESCLNRIDFLVETQ